MSLGFSVGDFLTLPALAWRICKSCKDSPTADFQSLSADVASLHTVLAEAVDHIQAQDSDPEKQEQFTHLGKTCLEVLIDIQAGLQKHESRGTPSQKGWDRREWGLEDVSSLRGKLATSTALLTALNTTIANSSQVRIERKLSQLLHEIRAGKREGSVVSVQTIESLSTEDQESLQRLRKELADVGIGSTLFLQHQRFIVSWLRSAVADGAFQETVYPRSMANAWDFSPTTEKHQAIDIVQFGSETPDEQIPAKKRYGFKRALQSLSARISVAKEPQTPVTSGMDVSKFMDEPSTPLKTVRPRRSEEFPRVERVEPSLKTKRSDVSLQTKAFNAGYASARKPFHKYSTSEGLSRSTLSSAAYDSSDSTLDNLPRRTFASRVKGRPPLALRPWSEGSSSLQRLPLLSENSDKSVRTRSGVGIKKYSHGDLDPELQKTFDRHEAVIKSLYFAKTPAEQAGRESARRSLKLNWEKSIEMVPPRFHDLASSGMEISLPSPGLTKPPGRVVSGSSMKCLPSVYESQDDPRANGNYRLPKRTQSENAEERIHDSPWAREAEFVNETSTPNDLMHRGITEDPGFNPGFPLVDLDGTELTPLLKAARMGHSDMVVSLLQEGADIRTTDSLGRTALHIAVDLSDEHTVQMILDNVPAKSIPELWDSSILHSAIRTEAPSVALLLLQHGAQVDRLDESGASPLQLASHHDLVSVVEDLKTRGAKVDVPENENETALYEAAMAGDIDAMDVIISHDAVV